MFLNNLSILRLPVVMYKYIIMFLYNFKFRVVCYLKQATLKKNVIFAINSMKH